MKGAQPPRTDDVLRLVRSSSDPLASDEQRLWSRIAERAGMSGAGPELRDDAAPPPQRAHVGVRARTTTGSRVPVPPVLRSFPRVALWAAFGVSMAALGYGMGAQWRAPGPDTASRSGHPRTAASERAPALEQAAPAPRAIVLAPVPPTEAAPAAVPAPPTEAAPAAVPAPPTEAAPAAVPAPEAGLLPAPPELTQTVPAVVERAPAKRPAQQLRSAPRAQPTGGSAPVRGPVPPLPASVEQPKALGLREALRLLGRAQAAVRLGTAGDALDWLDQLEQRNPGTLLEQERLVTRALALCGLGEVSKARAAREQLERLDPESIYRGQLQASCAKKP